MEILPGRKPGRVEILAGRKFWGVRWKFLHATSCGNFVVQIKNYGVEAHPSPRASREFVDVCARAVHVDRGNARDQLTT